MGKRQDDNEKVNHIKDLQMRLEMQSSRVGGRDMSLVNLDDN